MMYRILEPYLIALLPLYSGGKLNWLPRRLIAGWLAGSESGRARLQMMAGIRQALQDRPAPEPSPAVWGQIRRNLEKTSPIGTFNRRTWALGMGLALLLVGFVLVFLPPANVIAWSVEGTAPVAFKVYRATRSNDLRFQQVREISAGADRSGYRFVDSLLLPGRSYVYRVDAVGLNGATLSSEIVTAGSRTALPGQIAILAAAAICFYGLLVYLTDRSRGVFAWAALVAG